MNRKLKLQIQTLLLSFIISQRLWADDAWLRSAENQVFQFMQSGACTNWADGSKNQSSAYLWIPENCKKIRGLLILCANVPEHRLVGHPTIRAACAANDLGIVWCVPSFMNFRKSKETSIDNAHDYQTSTAFLQELLDGLAKESGYAEVASAPWLPIGESGHLLMVDALVEFHTERCIAGVWLKNNHLPPKNGAGGVRFGAGMVANAIGHPHELEQHRQGLPGHFGSAEAKPELAVELSH